MFEIKRHIHLGGSFHRIVSNRFVLSSDDDRELIFTGTNATGNRIIAAIIEHGDTSTWYFHLIIDEKRYALFVARKLTLLDMMNSSEFIYVVEYYHDLRERSFSMVSFDEIPDKYRPRSRSFCPRFAYVPSFEYSTSMKGGLADAHMANPAAAASVANSIYGMLKEATDFIPKYLKVPTQVNLEGGHALAASYRLDFCISFDTDNHLFAEKRDDIARYLKNVLDYVMAGGVERDGLPSEENPSEAIVSLGDELKDIFKTTTDVPPWTLPDESNSKVVARAVDGALRSLRNIQFEGGYDHIVFANKGDGGASMPVAVIDSHFVQHVAVKAGQSDVLEEVVHSETDDAPFDYTIEVEKLDRRNGKGEALVHLNAKDRVVALFAATGRNTYDHTVLSKSLNDKVAVTIKGRATRKKGVIRSIKFDLSDQG